MGEEKADHKQRAIGRLLGRGGQTLGLAATAHARGQRAGDGPWHVLAPQLVAAAEQVLGVLAEENDPDSLSSAVGAAMGAAPATAAPSWAGDLWRDPELLARLGCAVPPDALAPALPVQWSGTAEPVEALDHRERGLAAVAVALGRSVDGVEALAAELAPAEGERLIGMATLAGSQVAPGEPSRMRSWLKEWIKGERADG